MTQTEVEIFAAQLAEHEIVIPVNMRIVVKVDFSKFFPLKPLDIQKDNKGVSFVKINTQAGIPIYLIE